MQKSCEANMDSGKLDLRSTLYIRSNHPLAFRIIEKILVDTPHDTKPFPAQQVGFVDGSSWALILDTCSVEEWPELTSQCRLNGGRTIVLVSRHPQPHEELRLIYLGVHGIVPMSNLEDELPRVVDLVLQGGLWVKRSTFYEYVKRSNRSTGMGTLHPGLTIREEQIVVFLSKRFSNKEIGNILQISERTVKFHVSNILQKFNVDNRKEIQGIIKDSEEPPDDPLIAAERLKAPVPRASLR
jgi:DNA-binding NarL/FixJ family response regulator